MWTPLGQEKMVAEVDLYTKVKLYCWGLRNCPYLKGVHISEVFHYSVVTYCAMSVYFHASTADNQGCETAEGQSQANSVRDTHSGTVVADKS